jgi:hypothetical protein
MDHNIRRGARRSADIPCRSGSVRARSPRSQPDIGEFTVPAIDGPDAGDDMWFFYADEVIDWIQALHDHHMTLDFQGDHEWELFVRHYVGDPMLLESVDLETIRKVLTDALRWEGEVPGHLMAMFDQGVIHAAMRRLRVLGEPN